MSTHKTLKVTLWTRIWDLFKGILLYGSVNWSRASDGLKPPKLTPRDRKQAMPAIEPEFVRPRENPQNSIIKAQPKKVQPKKWDITAGAIVSDPLLPEDGASQPFPKRQTVQPPVEPSHDATAHEESELVGEEIASADNEVVIVRRRKRSQRHGLLSKRAPRSAVQYIHGTKRGLLSRWFGLK